MYNETVKAEARDTFERAVNLFREGPTSQAYFALKDAALCLQETSKLPNEGLVEDEHISHRSGCAAIKVRHLEELREDAEMAPRI